MSRLLPGQCTGALRRLIPYHRRSRRPVHALAKKLGISRPTLLLWRQRYADLQPHRVERFFGEITRKRLRRGTFRSVPALIATIRTYDREHNKDPRPFIWTASASSILRKISVVKKR
jgi:hypothetical protein